MNSRLLKLLLAFGLMFSIAACDTGGEEGIEVEDTPTDGEIIEEEPEVIEEDTELEVEE